MKSDPDTVPCTLVVRLDLSDDTVDVTLIRGKSIKEIEEVLEPFIDSLEDNGYLFTVENLKSVELTFDQFINRLREQLQELPDAGEGIEPATSTHYERFDVPPR